MVLLVSLVVLAVIGLVTSIAAVANDGRSTVRAVWGYDTRRPMLP